MPGVLDLGDVLQLVVDGLYDGPLPEQQFVRDAHQRTFHVVPELRDELYAIDEKPFKEVLADISLVRHELPVDELHENLVFERLPVTHISRRYHEVTPVRDKIRTKRVV